MLISDRTMVNEDEEEIVTYMRESREFSVCKYSVKFEISNFCFSSDMCKNCDHVIARHEYTFTVVDDYQVSRALNSTTAYEKFNIHVNSTCLKCI